MARFAFGLLSVAGITLGGATEAQADTITCSPNRVAWATNAGGAVQVYCDGDWYYGYGSHADADCGANAIDARKAWLSLAQAALLAGKDLYIEYTAQGSGSGECSSGRAITYLRLKG